MNQQHVERVITQLLSEIRDSNAGAENINVDEQGVIFARDLISMSRDVYMEEMPAPVAISMFAKEPGVHDGAQWAGYRMYSAQGMAKIMAAFGTEMPMMAAKGKEHFARIYDYGLGYGYSYADIRAAAMANAPLDNILAMTTRDAHERTISNVIWNGEPEYNIVGFSKHPNIPLVALVGGWGTADGDVMCDDVSALIAAINTSKIYDCNEVHFPSQAWSKIQGKRLTGVEGTVLTFLRRSYPEIVFKKNTDLDDSGSIEGLHNTRRHFAQATPFVFRQMPLQRTGLDLSIPCVSATAGVIVRAPLAAARSSKVI